MKPPYAYHYYIFFFLFICNYLSSLQLQTGFLYYLFVPTYLCFYSTSYYIFINTLILIMHAFYTTHYLHYICITFYTRYLPSCFVVYYNSSSSSFYIALYILISSNFLSSLQLQTIPRIYFFLIYQFFMLYFPVLFIFISIHFTMGPSNTLIPYILKFSIPRVFCW